MSTNSKPPPGMDLSKEIAAATAGQPTPPEGIDLATELEQSRRRIAELEARAAQAGIRLTQEPTKPAIPIVTAASVDFDVTAMEAESTKRNLEYQSTVELVRDNLMMGRFYGVPSALAERNFHFVRVGLKGDPRTERKAQILRDKGYINAPPSVRAMGKGYETDGDRALIMCASAAAHMNLLRDKAARTRGRIERLHGQKQKDIEQKLRDSLPKGTDVHLTAHIGSTRNGIAGFDNEMAAALRDLPRS